MTRPSTASARPALHGKHVVIGLLIFFAVVISVNAGLILSAVSTYSGMVADEPYRKGLHYNQRIAASTRQAELGWHEQIKIGDRDHIVLSLRQADGRPVSGLKIAGAIGRPSTNRQDIPLQLTETTAGDYAVRTGALAAGTWLISLEARESDTALDPIYRIRRRLWLEQ